MLYKIGFSFVILDKKKYCSFKTKKLPTTKLFIGSTVAQHLHKPREDNTECLKNSSAALMNLSSHYKDIHLIVNLFA